MCLCMAGEAYHTYYKCCLEAVPLEWQLFSNGLRTAGLDRMLYIICNHTRQLDPEG